MTSKTDVEDRDDSGLDDDDKGSPPSYHKGDTLSSDSKKGKGKAPVIKSPMKTAVESSTRWAHIRIVKMTKIQQNFTVCL